ncbi:MAG: O-antigen ligase family protein [Capsulimonadaceae bacterium]
MNLSLIVLVAALFASPFLAAIPEEPVWSALIGAALLAGFLVFLLKPDSRLGARTTPVRTAALYLGWTLLSAVLHAVWPHPTTTLLDVLIRGTVAVAVYVVAFLLARALAARDARAAAAIAMAVVVAAMIISVMALQEYAYHWRSGQPQWRVFATSTPDNLACYLLMTAPLTIAALFALPAGNSFRLLLGISAALQVAAIGVTGSRFAFVSLPVGLVVLAAGLWRSRSVRVAAKASPPWRTAAIALALLLLGIYAGRPLFHRFGASTANSGAFRVWTWRGSLRMAAHSPLLGFGPGTYSFAYPQFALVGFTRAAHDSYLQVADETGIPAALLVIALVGVSIAAAWRWTGSTPSLPKQEGEAGEAIGVVAAEDPGAAESRKRPSRSKEAAPAGAGPRRGLTSRISRAAEPVDDPVVTPAVLRAIAAGAAAALAAGAIQNLIDSDLYVFALGVTFYSLAGLACGLAGSRPTAAEAPAPPQLRLAVGIAAVVVAVVNLSNGAAAWQAQRARDILAQSSPDPAAAQAAYAGAMSLAPLNGQYPSDVGMLIDGQDQAASIACLRTASKLLPDSTNEGRLGRALEAAGDTAGALSAYQQGLKQDPNRMDLMLELAALQPPAASIQTYRRITMLEASPVGQVLALGNNHDPAYAIADNIVAGDCAAHGNQAGARAYYLRVVADLEVYVRETCSADQQRRGENNEKAKPDYDRQLATLYDGAMDILERGAPDPAARAVLAGEKQVYDGRFALYTGYAYEINGDMTSAEQEWKSAESILSAMPSGARPSDLAEAYARLQETRSDLKTPPSRL